MSAYTYAYGTACFFLGYAWRWWTTRRRLRRLQEALARLRQEQLDDYRKGWEARERAR